MSRNSTREEALFAAALAQPTDRRGAFLERECGANTRLLQRLLELLAAHGGSDSLLRGAALREGDGEQAAPAAALIHENKPGDAIGPPAAASAKAGRYKLLQKIGEGGCGLVWMAEQEEPVRRRVALKIIKLGMDTKAVVARFEAERQALAMMDHPGIARVYDAGATETGRPYFVMELVRGIPITRYCDENQLTPAERVGLMIQVCHAVQHAHQKGIVHRDLKPSNILVASTDVAPTPKVIDFGIAKATQGKLTEATVFTAFEQFIGTPVYMSPEQAEMNSLDVDARSDIYSLGVLLYELLTGQPPFDAKAFAQAGIDVIRRQIRETDPLLPSARLGALDDVARTTIARRRGTAAAQLSILLRGDLDWIVMRCLEKDRTRRYESAHELALDLQRHLRHEPVLARPPSTIYLIQKLLRRHGLGFIAAVGDFLGGLAEAVVRAWQPKIVVPWLLAFLFAGLFWWKNNARPPDQASVTARSPAAVTHATIVLPPDAPLAPPRALPLAISYPSLALSPDGTRLVYTALVGGRTQLYSRLLDQVEVRPIPHTEGGYLPFFSPDGRWIGFFADSKLKKISVLGGTAVNLCDAGLESSGAFWADDGTIFFTSWPRLLRVSDRGGDAQSIHDRNGRGMTVYSPMTLPGTGHVLGSFFGTPMPSISGDYAPIEALSFGTGTRTSVVDHGYHPAFLSSGHLVFARGIGLQAVAFDPAACRILGEPVPVLDGVMVHAIQKVAQYSISQTGTLVYAPGEPSHRTVPVWVDRNGNTTPVPIDRQSYGQLRLSPDGRRVAIHVTGVQDNVWVFDLETGKGAPVGEPGTNQYSIWTADGSGLVYHNRRDGKARICHSRVDGLHQPARTLYEIEGSKEVAPEAFSPVTGELLVHFLRGSEGSGLFALPADGSRTLQRIETMLTFHFVRFAPNGKYISFTAGQGGGRSEVYVQAYPQGSPIQVSRAGGEEAMWSADGREIFFRNGDAWLAAPVEWEPQVTVGEPRILFRGPYSNVPGYGQDVTPDGQRFLMLLAEDADRPVTELRVIVNWVEELKRRVPAGPRAARGGGR